MLQHVERDLGDAGHGVDEGLVAPHLEGASAGNPDHVRRAVRPHRDRPHAPLGGGSHHDGTGAVAEQGGGAAVVRVEKAVEAIDADHERLARAAGLELSGGHLERGHEGAARGADVDSRRVREPKCARDQRRCVGSHLVLSCGGHDHEVDLVGAQPRLRERQAARLGREVAHALAVLEGPALVDAGSALDPAGLDSEPLGDRSVADLGGRHGQRRVAHGRASQLALAEHAALGNRCGDLTHGRAPRIRPRPPRRRASCGRGL